MVSVGLNLSSLSEVLQGHCTGDPERVSRAVIGSWKRLISRMEEIVLKAMSVTLLKVCKHWVGAEGVGLG